MLKDLIQQDFKEASRNQEKVRLSVLKMLRADIIKKQQDKRKRYSFIQINPYDQLDSIAG